MILLRLRATVVPYATLFRSRSARPWRARTRGTSPPSRAPSRGRVLNAPAPVIAAEHFRAPEGKTDAQKCSAAITGADRKSTHLNSRHTVISYAVFSLKEMYS